MFGAFRACSTPGKSELEASRVDLPAHLIEFGSTVVTCIVLAIIFIDGPDTERVNSAIFRGTFAVCLTHRNIFFFTLIRLASADLNVIIEPIVGSIRRSIPFCFTVGCFIIVAFTVYLCFPIPFDDEHGVVEAFIELFKFAVLADFDVYELEGQGPVWKLRSDGSIKPEIPQETASFFLVRFMIIVFGLAFPVLLLNILISVLGVWLDFSIQHVWRRFQSQRLELVLDYMSFKAALDRILCFDTCWEDRRHIWFACLDDHEGGGEGTTISSMFLPAVNKVSELEHKMQHQQDKVTQVLNSVKNLRQDHVATGPSATHFDDLMQLLHTTKKFLHSSQGGAG